MPKDHSLDSKWRDQSTGKETSPLDLRIFNCCCCSVANLCLTLQPHGLQHPGLPCPFFTIFQSSLKLMSIESVMLSISSFAVPFSFCLQSFPASGSFPMSRLLASDGQSIAASASASVLPMNIQGLFPLGLTGLISLLSKELSRVFSSTTIQKHQFFGSKAFLWSYSHQSL